jgi:hypothetical protein
MAYPDTPTSPGGISARRLTNRNTNRYSVTALFSMAAEQDVEVEDDLARGTYYYSTFCVPLSLNNSPEASTGPERKDFCTVQEEFCS